MCYLSLSTWQPYVLTLSPQWINALALWKHRLTCSLAISTLILYSHKSVIRQVFTYERERERVGRVRERDAVHVWFTTVTSGNIYIRAVRNDDIYRMEEIKSLSFHIMFYRLYRGVAKYIVSGNTFSSFEWLRSLYAAHHGAWRGDRTTSQDKTRSSFPNEGLHL